MKKIYLLIISALLLIGCASAQNIDKISRKCPNTNSTYASILVTINGDITQVPCPTRTNIFTGNVDFSGATVTGISGIISGGTTNRIPYFTSATSLGSTGASWSGTQYKWRDLGQTSTFDMSLTPSALTTGNFVAGGGTSFLSIDEPTLTTNLTQTSNTGVVNISGGATTGGVNLTANTGAGLQKLSLNNLSNNHIYIGNGTSFITGIDIGTLDATSSITANANNVLIGNVGDTVLTWNTRKFAFAQRTLTAGGTTGDQIINQSVGSVNLAGAASSLVVTSTMALTTSLIFLTPQTADATCTSFAVTRAAGSFTITANAACTGETTIAFYITN